jgi:hypothetical protein
MQVFAALGVFATIAVSAELDAVAAPPQLAPVITTIKANKNYAVKLDCLGCPFAIKDADHKVTWQDPPQENALV